MNHLASDTKIFWQSIACKFGVPYEVIVDNGKQFDSTNLRRFCFNLGTKLCFSSVYHPETKGVVERPNGIIFMGIKINLTGMARGNGSKSCLES
jgi:transposase InsO family protein